MKHQLVSAATLTKASLRLQLGDFLRFGRGEEKSGGRRKDALLADVLEAITGAIFLDGGLEAARSFVEHALSEELARVNPVTAAEADYKTMLQEKLQAERRSPPRYAVVETAGPPHKRVFHVELAWDGGSVRAEGPINQSCRSRCRATGAGNNESRSRVRPNLTDTRNLSRMFLNE